MKKYNFRTQRMQVSNREECDTCELEICIADCPVIVRADQETLAGRCQIVRDAWRDFIEVCAETLRRDLQAINKWIRYRAGKGGKK